MADEEDENFQKKVNAWIFKRRKRVNSELSLRRDPLLLILVNC